MAVRLLHTNDMHGNLCGTCFERLLELRARCDLYFDSGDVIKAGNLSIPLKRDAAWERLKELDCTASTLGNRETHVLESAFHKKIEGASHPILVANLRCRDGSRALPASLKLDVRGTRVGVLGVMVPMVTERMKTQAASAYLWDQPIPAAIEVAKQLRGEVDLLIALTHVGYRVDVELAEACPELDVILGGHSHTVLGTPTLIGKTSVCQGGSHCKYAGVYEWTPESGLRGVLEPISM